MSTNTTNPPPSISAEQEQREKVMHNLALGLVIVCPILIIIPPRKLDLYTLSLTVATGFGANRLLQERDRGSSAILSRIPRFDGLPNDRAREVQMKLKEAKEYKEREAIKDKLRRERGNASGESVSTAAAELRWETEAEAEARRRMEEDKIKSPGILRRLWMGKEKPDWKKERDMREKEALEEGKGYGDLIMDQIWEVWNWGQDKEIKEEDKKVVEAKKDEK